MDMFALVAAFGGGAFGALLGALPAFIMTGCFALAGALVAAGGGADIGVGFMAFGPLSAPTSPLPAAWRPRHMRAAGASSRRATTL